MACKLVVTAFPGSMEGFFKQFNLVSLVVEEYTKGSVGIYIIRREKQDDRHILDVLELILSSLEKPALLFSFLWWEIAENRYPAIINLYQSRQHF